MARGAQHDSGRAWPSRRVLIPAMIVMLLLLIPATARASGGTSQWTPPGGSSTWSPSPEADPPDPIPPETPPPPRPAADLAATEPPAEDSPVLTVDGIIFPVSGPATYSASFGAPRPGGRTHEGVDIFADKMTPVVAAASGTISFIRDGIGTDCCVIRIRHDNGRSSLYLHLNNDTPGTDDGQGYGIAEGIARGVRVEAGTIIGYVGDSGNAEETPSHLHFELSDSTGTELDPFPYLQIAQGAAPALFASALLVQPESLPDTGLPVAGLFLASLGMLAGGSLLAGRRRSD